MASIDLLVARRRRKPDPIEAIAPIGVLIALVGVFVPGGRELLFGIVGLILGILVLVGIVFILIRITRRRDGVPELLDVAAAYRPRSAHRIQARPTLAWTHELLHELEWKRFEEVVEGYFDFTGYRSVATRIGADGGVDIKLYQDSDPIPAAIVQCKAWNSYTVGVKPIRELFGVMAAETVARGIFVTTSTFTAEARAFAEGKALELIDASAFLEKIQLLESEAQTKLLAIATDGDYTTPTCPSCGTKMVERTAGKGSNAGSKFWGCRNYPRCKRTFQISRERAPASGPSSGCFGSHTEQEYSDGIKGDSPR